MQDRFPELRDVPGFVTSHGALPRRLPEPDVPRGGSGCPRSSAGPQRAAPLRADAALQERAPPDRDLRSARRPRCHAPGGGPALRRPGRGGGAALRRRRLAGAPGAPLDPARGGAELLRGERSRGAPLPAHPQLGRRPAGTVLRSTGAAARPRSHARAPGDVRHRLDPALLGRARRGGSGRCDPLGSGDAARRSGSGGPRLARAGRTYAWHLRATGRTRQKASWTPRPPARCARLPPGAPAREAARVVAGVPVALRRAARLPSGTPRCAPRRLERRAGHGQLAASDGPGHRVGIRAQHGLVGFPDSPT